MMGTKCPAKVRRPHAAPTLALVLLPLVFGRCGGDEAGGATSADTGTDSTEIGEFKIGVLIPKSGANAAFGPPVGNAVQLAVEQINEAGGVLGVKIALVERDTRSKPESGLEAALGLAGDPSVRAIIGALSSSVTEQVVGVSAEVGLPVISPASTSPTLTTIDDGGTFFRTVPSDALQGKVMANYALASSYKSAAILYADNSYGANLQARFTAEFEGAGGEVVAAIGHDAETVEVDYVRDLEKISKQPKPVDVILLITYEKQGVQILTDQKLFDLKAAWLLADGLRTEALSKEAGASTLAGIRGTAPTAPSGPAHTAFRQAWLERYGVEPGVFTAQAYDAVHLIVLAALRSGSLRRSELLSQLNSISIAPGVKVLPGDIPTAVPQGDVDFEGSSGPVDWDEFGDPSIAVYEVYEFQPDGSISRVCELTPTSSAAPCLP